jgi:hypothetical protein
MQEWIYKKLLLLVGPGPAIFYQDACSLMAESFALQSTTHLVAHLLRDIESALRDVLEPIVENAKPVHAIDESAKHKSEILAILSYLDISESDPISIAWIKLAGRGSTYALHARAHRRNLSPPRPFDEDFIRFWADAQMILKIVLDKFEARYSRVFDVLDRIIARTRPSAHDIEQLRTHVPNNMTTWRYFFGRLPTKEWLTLLKEAGFFDAPPKPQVDDENGTMRLIPWPRSQYLARAASSSPTQVLEVILDIPDTENTLVHSDLVDAALVMPQELAARFAEKEAAWLDAHESIDFLLPQKLAELVGHLAKGKQVEAALTLARSLLQILPPKKAEGYAITSEPRARFDTWNYEQILQNQLPTLAVMAGEKTVAMLCELLESAVRLYRQGLGPEDYSSLWRPAVEDNDQNRLSDPKELLVSAVRDAALQTIEAEQSRLPTIIEELKKRKWFIFQRMGIHILNIFSKGSDALIAERLTDRTIFDQPTLWHEYSLLIQNHFADLSPENQHKILKWIDDGPDVDDLVAGEKRSTHKTPTREETERYVKHWQLSHLTPIRASLPEEWKPRYRELTKEFGEPERPEFLVRSVARFGPTSPKKAQELKSLSVADIVQYLKEWRPSGGILAPSPEGLGRELTTVTSSDPIRFASDANSFRELDPTYVRSILSGFTEAVKNKLPFAWATVLELCQWVVKQPRTAGEQENISLEFDVGWTQTRKTIARLLSKGFETGPSEIPFDLRNIVWQIIEPLTKDPDPTPERERDYYDPQSLDPASLAINTVRGGAIHAVVHYSLWVKREFEKASGKAVGFESMPEVQEVLEAHLDPNIENTLAIRTIYGQYLPWLFLLDEHWTLSRLSAIFPSNESLRDFRDAAWETYLVYCRPYENVVNALREEYARALDRLDEPQVKWRHLAEPRERLSEHLMILFWHGKLDLEDALLVHFFERAPDSLCGHALSFIGRELFNAKAEISASTLQRLKALWESRIHSAQSSTSSHESEFSAFGWWFASGKFDDEWALTQLSASLRLADQTDAGHQVIRRLADLTSEFPEQVIDCLSQMITSDKGTLLGLVWREQVLSILTATINSTDLKAREKTVVLVNRLIALGHLEFRDLTGKD